MLAMQAAVRWNGHAQARVLGTLWTSSQCWPGALQEFREVAKLYPMIQAQEMIVDNTCMQLVGKPNQFDVMVRSTALWCRVLGFCKP